MLQTIRLIDFKSFADETVEVAPLTFLVGTNASGKSNFLDALRFLHGLQIEMSLAEVLDGEEHAAYDAWPGIRGRAAEAARFGMDCFAIESAWEVCHEDIDHATQAVAYRIACRTHPQPRLEAERLCSAGEPSEELFSTGPVIDGKIEVPWSPVPWPGRGAEKAQETMLLPADRSVLWEVLGSVVPGHPQVPGRVAEYAHTLSLGLSQIRFLETEPAQMRDYGQPGRPLGPAGKNLSGVLAHLCSDPERKRSLVDWLAALCAPEIEDIDFIHVEHLGDVMAVLVERDGRRVSMRSVSDGTLYFLGLLVALHTAEPGSVILIEEIGAGLHPARVRLLVEWLQVIQRERNLQIIATTHAPTVLQWLDDETLGNTILFARVPEQPGTVMRRLRDLPHFHEIVRQVGIVEMFTTSWLEMAL